MECGRCGAANGAGSRFCDQCGSALAIACATCGAANRPEARFCATCGAALEPVAGRSRAPAGAARGSRPTPGPGSDGAAERRLVTVLFADLVGFTPFAEEQDPEETRELLTAYFDRTRLVIERHGGRVEKFIGDAVMAVWGTPVAHEDDAERAVRAALEVVAAVDGLGPGLEARAGVLTGEAAVDLEATDEALVAGDLVNTAARLQSVAPPGAVIVGESTMRAVSGTIALEPVGPQLLKGKSAPVAAWQALRVLAERGVRADALEPPFVGRAEELRSLKDLLHATGRERRPRLVSISGPAGIGKSRLASELGKYVDGLTEAVYWHRGRSPSYGDGIAFWALGEMIRRRAGLAEQDDEATTRARLRAMLVDYVPDEVDRRWLEPAVLTLVGLEPAPPGGREVLFSAWRILFERVAERGTTVLLFEDLHWADDGLLDFIDHLLSTAKGVPILVVTLARPELFERRPGWLSGLRSSTGMVLEPLPEPAMRALLDGLVPGLPASTMRTVLDRADGVPMYAVEIVRALVADGRLERDGDAFRPVGDLTEVRVPETLQSLIASRLDGLEPADRGVLQDASVLGQTFSLDGLAATSGVARDELEARLRGLVRRELLRVDVDPASPERGQYGFVQSLVREVAYGTLARRERRAKHLAVARYFETLDDPELAGGLASHYLAAQRASSDGPEADALAIQARRALRAAGERAIALGANAQAAKYLGEALSITDAPADRAELLELSAKADDRSGAYEPAMAAIRAAIDAHRAAGDAVGAIRATGQLGTILIDAALISEAADTFGAALAELDAVAAAGGARGIDELRATLEARRSRALMRATRDDEAIAAADRALAVAERYDLTSTIAEAFVNKGSALGSLGRWREGAAILEAAIGLTADTGEIDLQLRAMNNLGATIVSADPVRARRAALETIELGERLGSRTNALWSTVFLLNIDSGIGRDWDSVDGILGHALELANDPSDRARLLWRLLSFQVDRGEVDDVLATELAATVGAFSDPDLGGTAEDLSAHRAFVDGNLVAAYDGFLRHAALEGQSRFFSLAGAGLAAIRLGDRGRLEAVVELARATPGSGWFYEATLQLLDAGVAALEGRPDAEPFQRAFDAYGPWDFSRAEAQLTVLHVLPAAPEAPVWAAAAREVFERCRARPHLATLDRVVGSAPAAGAGHSAPSGDRGGVSASASPS